MPSMRNDSRTFNLIIIYWLNEFDGFHFSLARKQHFRPHIMHCECTEIRDTADSSNRIHIWFVRFVRFVCWFVYGECELNARHVRLSFSIRPINKTHDRISSGKRQEMPLYTLARSHYSRLIFHWREWVPADERSPENERFFLWWIVNAKRIFN